MLRKIECYVTKSKLEKLRDRLLVAGVPGMSVSEVKGIGTRNHKDTKGKPQLEDRIKIEIVVDERKVDAILDELRTLAVKGELGSGMVFVSPVEDAVRIGTHEQGSSALV